MRYEVKVKLKNIFNIFIYAFVFTSILQISRPGSCPAPSKASSAKVPGMIQNVPDIKTTTIKASRILLNFKLQTAHELLVFVTSDHSANCINFKHNLLTDAHLIMFVQLNVLIYNVLKVECNQSCTVNCGDFKTISVIYLDHYNIISREELLSFATQQRNSQENDINVLLLVVYTL